jgi:hypothetical protein
MVDKHDWMGIQTLKERQQGTVPGTEARPYTRRVAQK